MNFSDMLGYADIAQLSRIAQVYDCRCNGNSKHELIQAILSKAGSREGFDAQIGSMKLEELRFINSLIFDSREQFSLEELIARVQSSRDGLEPASEPAQGRAKGRAKKGKPPAEPEGPRDMIVRFKHYGWLFNGISGPDRYLFRVPKDLKDRFRQTLKRKFAERLVFTDEPPVYRDEQELLAGDVKALLSYVRHHEVPLTREGYMHRRSMLQAMESFGVREEPPAKAAWRFGYGRRFREYPERFSLVYDFCFYNKWLEETESELLLTPLGEAALLGAQPFGTEQLYRFWLRLYKGPVPNLAPMVHWVDELADRWVTADSLREVLIPYVKPYYYDTAEAVMDSRILMMMLHLGLLRIGEEEQRGTVLRMTRLGRAIVAGVSVEHGDVLRIEAGAVPPL
ncbi:hypothetical protein NYE40_10945 [Paenibacillus sp. FSL W8-1187]|uniref:Helicase XPB/Ssl2 N-terminal domain-containing protein n=1 Tax=Paenibacillus pasadenensis TaxID=217090 RepID=A0A2N5N5V7_9BACL|nr:MULTISPECIES: hypothetical protein [Paenibacillus]PLT45669.1 hypothetical protein B8V81_4100 [Paenibacillus pasadenensis]QGG56114.1 hypothetical protein GE073_11365 [Paenibacillus sp. B01]